MSKLTLNQIAYYDINDVYCWETDNRPLYDISSNVDLINTAISNLGFYQEVYANPDTEPAGGFSPLTCVWLGQNGRIYPIDISQSIVTIDYTKYSIYLIIESLGSSKYKCLGFSASYSIQSLYNKFLPDSIGKAIKVGPGGTLVDEIYFDLYYANYGYQNIIVGKVLAPTVISFGGNQVSVLGDNKFLARNKDDSTTGLVTRFIKNEDNSTAVKTELINTANSQYPFTEYVNYIYTPYGQDSERTPIYFSSTPLEISGNSFTVDNLESVLNEVHFASPAISADSLTDTKYRTSGVNIGTMLSYASNYLLHGKQLATNLAESNQIISTSLTFEPSETTTGLLVQFGSAYANFGITPDAMISSVLSASNSTASGVALGPYTSGSGSIICNLTNSISAETDFGTTNDNYFDMSSTVSGNALVIYNKGVSGSVILGGTGPVLISSTAGAYYKNTPTKNYELANKGYVDAVGISAANTANTRIPLAGTTSEAPATGGIYFDLKSNGTDPNTVLTFDTLLRTDVRSGYPIEFKTLNNSGYQILRGETPQTGNNNDLINRSFLATALNNLITNAIGSRFVRTDAEDTITAPKTFSDTSQIITQSAMPFSLRKESGMDEIAVETDATAIVFTGLNGLDTAKVRSSQTVTTDDDATLTTKKFVMDQIEAAKPMGSLFSIWDTKAPGATTYLSNYLGWAYGTRGKYGEQKSDSFSEWFELVEDGALLYKGTETILLNINMSAVNSKQKGNVGFSGSAKKGSLQISILVKTGATVKQILHATNGSYIETYIQHHGGKNDSDEEKTRTVYTGSSLCSGLVIMRTNDILYPLAKGSDTITLSIIKAG